MSNEPNPAMLIFMRNDLASMNPGKAVAQGGHCCTMLEHDISFATNEQRELHKIWADSTSQGFGTNLVFSITEAGFDLIRDLVENNPAFEGALSNICHDPSYPIRDGKVTHYIPLNTSAYIFMDLNKLPEKVIKFFSQRKVELMA